MNRPKTTYYKLLVILFIIGAGYLGVALYKGGYLGVPPGRQIELFGAIWSDDTNKFVSLINRIDINGRSIQLNGPTPLIDAAKFGRLEMVEMLLDRGANPNTGDYSGFTPLFYALDSPFLGGKDDLTSSNIIAILLDHGADVTAKGVANAALNLSVNDPRFEISQKLLKSR